MVAGTITGLEVQKHNHERVSVYVDDEFMFGLPVIEAARLHNGQKLSDDEIAALRAVDDVARAVDRAVKLLARRPYSIAEIRQNLASHDIAPGTIDEALAKLEHLGYVDDHAFAAYWIENREQFRPRSPRALRYELRKKGVADSVIQASLNKIDPHDSAYRAAQDRLRRNRGLDRQTFRNKLGGFLARRGFTYDIVRDTVDQLIHELETEQPDYFAVDNSNEE